MWSLSYCEKVNVFATWSITYKVPKQITDGKTFTHKSPTCLVLRIFPISENYKENIKFIVESNNDKITILAIETYLSHVWFNPW